MTSRDPIFDRCLQDGHAARLAGRFSEARKAYIQSLLQCVGDQLAPRADALCGLAMVDRAQCRYDSAIRNFNMALEVYEFLRDPTGQAFVLYGRGGAYRFLARYDEAKKDLEKALKLAPDRESEIFTRMALGGLLRMMSAYRKSLTQYRKARALAGRSRHQYAMAYADCGIGNAHRMLGHRSDARKHLGLAEKRYTEIGDIVSRPYTLFAISLMDFEDGMPGRLDEAETLFRRTSDDRGMIHVWLARGVAALAAGRTAREDLARASRLAVKIGLRLEAAHASFLLRNSSPARIGSYKALRIPAPESIFLLP